MIANITKRIRQGFFSTRSFVRTQTLSVNYGIEGILAVGALSIVGNNNNLFAQRLGADDFQLSLLQLVPNLLILLLLIPAGIFADSLRNKRIMIAVTMVVAGIFYSLVSATAFVPVHTVYIFIIVLSVATVSGAGMYNLSWQSFFPEAVEEGRRNMVLTFRARMTMIVQLVVPLVVGAILTAIISTEGKIVAHQAFYLLAAVLLFSNAFHLRKIKSVNPSEPKSISFAEMKIATGRLVRNKKFLIFTFVLLFFHATWHMDWTLYFIGQANYLQMNEFLLGLTPVGGMAAQLITLRFWSKLNTKKGVEHTLTFGIFGMATHAIAMIVAVSLPAPFSIITFLFLHFVAMLTFANITLSVFQNLLKVVDEEYRSFFISVYTCLITLSNAVMPMVGVLLYRALGDDLNAFRYTFVIVFALRIGAGLLWLWSKKKIASA